MFMSIRWAFDTVELEQFPGQTREALVKLQPGTFTAIRISEDKELFVKRLTKRAFQLGVTYGNSVRALRRTANNLCSAERVA